MVFLFAFIGQINLEGNKDLILKINYQKEFYTSSSQQIKTDYQFEPFDKNP